MEVLLTNLFSKINWLNQYQQYSVHNSSKAEKFLILSYFPVCLYHVLRYFISCSHWLFCHVFFLKVEDWKSKNQILRSQLRQHGIVAAASADPQWRVQRMLEFWKFRSKNIQCRRLDFPMFLNNLEQCRTYIMQYSTNWWWFSIGVLPYVHNFFFVSLILSCNLAFIFLCQRTGQRKLFILYCYF